MEIGRIVTELFTDYTLRTVALGSAVLGIVSGVLGAYAVLRRQSLLGDAVSHAALPGITLAFMLTSSKAPLVLIIGAALAGWLGTLLIMSIVRNTRIKYDTALGMVLSVFFGIGLVLLTFIQKKPDAAQAGLDKFLFGQASALLERDVITMSVLGGIVILMVFIFWKEFKLLCFDTDFIASMGYPVKILDIVLTSLLVIAIVIGLQTVGVVLMSAMVVAPASAARQWTDRLGIMMILSACFGAIAGVSGAVISSLTENLPTGPTIILCISAIVLVSITLAPNRGLVWRFIKRYLNSKNLRSSAVLCDLYELALQHDSHSHPHTEEVLNTMAPGKIQVKHALNQLYKRGLVQEVSPNQWILTEKGASQAKSFREEVRR